MLTRQATTRGLGPVRRSRAKTADGICADTLVATDAGLISVQELTAGSDASFACLVDRRAGTAGYLVRDGTSGCQVAPPVSGTYVTPAQVAGAGRVTGTIEIITESGYQLICAAGHEVLTTAGWVPAGQLEEQRHSVLIQSGAGEFATDTALPFVPPAEVTGASGKTRRYNFPNAWSEDLGFVLGWLAAGGWVRSGPQHGQVRFSFNRGQTDEMVRIRTIVNPWYGAGVRETARPAGGYQLTYYGQTIVEFCESLGLRPGPVEERGVPDALFTAPREAVAGFLRGLYSGAGCLPANGLGRFAPDLRLRHRSPDLLRGIQLLLIHAGIRSRICEGRRMSRWLVGQRTPVATGSRDTRPPGELIVSGEGLIGLRALLGLPAERTRAAGRFTSTGRAGNPTAIDEVVAIRPAGERTVYSVSEPASQSFIANGLVVRAAH